MLEWTEMPWQSKSGEAGCVTQEATQEERHQHLIQVTEFGSDTQDMSSPTSC